MNREEKRRFLNKLKRKGLSEYQKAQFLDFAIRQGNNETIAEGTKVKIDYEKITSNDDYGRKTDEYKNAIEKLKDKECTVVYEKKYGETPQLVCLEEDETDPKWIFYIGELIPIDEGGG